MSPVSHPPLHRPPLSCFSLMRQGPGGLQHRNKLVFGNESVESKCSFKRPPHETTSYIKFQYSLQHYDTDWNSYIQVVHQMQMPCILALGEEYLAMPCVTTLPDVPKSQPNRTQPPKPTTVLVVAEKPRFRQSPRNRNFHSRCN